MVELLIIMRNFSQGIFSLSEYFAIFEDHGITVSKENQNEKKFIVNFSLQTANQLYSR